MSIIFEHINDGLENNMKNNHQNGKRSYFNNKKK
jgi:hypothetical protein